MYCTASRKRWLRAAMQTRKPRIRHKLFAKGPDSILKKIGEECAELIMAGKEGNRLHVVWESTDVLYHMMVLLAFYGLSIDDVLQEMRRREGISGIDEKKARTAEVMEDCLFCKHRAGEIPSRKVYEDDEILAFHDIKPGASGAHPGDPEAHIDLAGKHVSRSRYAGARQDAGGRQPPGDRAGQPGRLPHHHQHGRIGHQEVPHLHIHIVGGPEPVGPMLKRV
jgi:phosphoribosyl-ATP pyrophosphohydrolase